jgi:hypothetical protein
MFLAGIAQLVEQLIRNQQVVGSSPIPGSTDFIRVSRGFSLLKPFFIVPQNGSNRLKIGPVCIQSAYSKDPGPRRG